jgi:hypothetical protein
VAVVPDAAASAAAEADAVAGAAAGAAVEADAAAFVAVVPNTAAGATEESVTAEEPRRLVWRQHVLPWQVSVARQPAGAAQQHGTGARRWSPSGRPGRPLDSVGR